ncbi:hypothetical protein [Bacillus halotolerans]|uniref:hypothetical protein n=1 Tax=Bacillus halotolerans TaxID=260554 RepID=UPI002DB78DB7|nr:hypothetical protein [Bacillus halotolerans]MEC1647086.1 hypothetical protein [Bacillus halotolerans]
MKFRQRYLLFSYSSFYPSGGLTDSVLNFDDYEELENWYKENYGVVDDEYIQIFDLDKREIIYKDEDKIDLDKVREIMEDERG